MFRSTFFGLILALCLTGCGVSATLTTSPSRASGSPPRLPSPVALTRTGLTQSTPLPASTPLASPPATTQPVASTARPPSPTTYQPTQLPSPTSEYYLSPDQKFYATRDRVVDILRNLSASIPPDQGQLTFWNWSSDSRYAIFGCAAASGRSATIVFDTFIWQSQAPLDGQPMALSPTAARLLLSSGALVDLNTHAQTQLFEKAQAFISRPDDVWAVIQAAWSPAGSHLAFIGQACTQSDCWDPTVYLANADGSQAWAIMGGVLETYTLQWSADEKFVTFAWDLGTCSLTTLATHSVYCNPPLTPTPAPAAILSFTADRTQVAPGDKITFAWKTTSQMPLKIHQYTGSFNFFMHAWEVDPNGSLTVVADGLERDTWRFGLEAFGDLKVIDIHFTCPDTYFFTPPAALECPASRPVAAALSEQLFENGRMLWLQPESLIFVLYPNGQLAAYSDSWTSAQPESDPTLEPPAGRYQPVRGFGQAWRTEPGLREKLGWAITLEQGYQSVYQHPWATSGWSTAHGPYLGSAPSQSEFYLRDAGGQTVYLNTNVSAGAYWKYLAP